jgi:putative membrane protein
LEVIAMMFWYGGHWMFWQSILGWAGMLVFWGLLIWGIYTLITRSRRADDRFRPGGDARQILDQRLARGEIDEAEYRRLRDLIESRDRQEQANVRR